MKFRLDRYGERQQATCGFVQVGQDVVTSAKCKHQLQFQRDEQHSATEQTMNIYPEIELRLRADGILIPHLHKALFVSGNNFNLQMLPQQQLESRC